MTRAISTLLVTLVVACSASGQSVCLPAPRLLTTMPMGGQSGSQLDVVITGQYLENVDQLLFSDPRITATAKLSEAGEAIPNTFVVSITEDCPSGVYDARVTSRLGVSSARAFSVSTLAEQTCTDPRDAVTSAQPVAINSICNAVLTDRKIDHYRFAAKQGQRMMIDCAARGIDSKTNPVLIVADAEGNDLVAQRRGGVIDFDVPADGDYIVKVHDLTFRGGPYCFYRLCIRELSKDETLQRMPSVKSVNTFSWPPEGLPSAAALAEIEPNAPSQPQQISLPCDLAGSFFPAADVDTYQFTAKKGELWWVEVGSERLGRPTDASIVVQRVDGLGGPNETLVDVVELSDIASPMKRSSNGYSYDGPPYNAGSADILGKLEIPEDGTYRLQIADLFGGTRNDPENVYRLIIRRGQPDFALVAWAMHMGLRNGDRNALSKPMSLRGGATIPLEVVVVRRDGFSGEIELEMQSLPDGVFASGIKIAAGKSRGIMLVRADQDAPRGMSFAKIIGRAQIDGNEVIRNCQLASMKWPVPNAASEIPAPRLVDQIPVSVGGSEFAGISIAPTEPGKVYEAKMGEKLVIPMRQTRRGEFSGAAISMRPFGPGFERARFEAPLNTDSSELTLDLASIKPPVGEHTIAFYGGAVAKYKYNPDAVLAAEDAVAKAKSHLQQLTAEAKRLAEIAATASEGEKASALSASQRAAAAQTAADASLKATEKSLRDAKAASTPKDIVDIYVTEPIHIRVNPADSK